MRDDAWLRAYSSWYGLPKPKMVRDGWAMWHNTAEVIPEREGSDCRDEECEQRWYTVDGLDPHVALEAATQAAQTAGKKAMARLMLEVWLEERDEPS